MSKLKTDTVDRFLDNALSPRASRRVAKMVEDSPMYQKKVDEGKRLKDLIQIMHEEKTKAVNFEGLSSRILDEIHQTEQPLSFQERLSTFFSEFFAHQRKIWVPAAAMSVAAMALFILPLATSSNLAAPHPTAGITLHSTTQTLSGSTIAAVDFGNAEGETFNIQNETGASVGVVWIRERP